ncbi:MAG TPA: carboxypeptidase-like regulatory domain-containing protein [Candidatus Hydrogenedentes bacterium]|nr:carboxypeptidase-like regulatory domain-containing protein [Candidatus Hydrogenedentota bacterium]HPG70138.1 carboxypeptidase-like regulatory domain-containing protein [Candidatus Hydrogenedentota bacterium]
MNKGFVVLAVAMAALVGLFFFAYFKDRNRTRDVAYEPLPAPVAAPAVEEPEPVVKQMPPAEPTPTPAEEPQPEPAKGDAAIEGQVVRAGTGEAVPKFEVKFEQRSGHLGADDKGFLEVEDAEGRFRLDQVPPGRGLVIVRAIGFKVGSAPVADIGAGQVVTDVVVQMTPVTLVRGLVKSARGGCVADALVFREVLPPESSRERQAVARSNDAGEFFYEPKMGGAMKLVVWHPNFAPAVSSVTPVPDETTECVVLLGDGATVEGRAWQGMNALVGLQVTMKPQFDDFGFEASAETDASGRFRIVKLPSCDATVSVILPGASEEGQRTKQWNGFLENGQTALVDFEFPVATSVVYGSVTYNGEMPERASLSLLVYSEAGEEGRFVEMAADGTFHFDAVPAGPASLTCEAEDNDGHLGFDEERFLLHEGEQREVRLNALAVETLGGPKTMPGEG